MSTSFITETKAKTCEQYGKIIKVRKVNGVLKVQNYFNPNTLKRRLENGIVFYQVQFKKYIFWVGGTAEHLKELNFTILDKIENEKELGKYQVPKTNIVDINSKQVERLSKCLKSKKFEISQIPVEKKRKKPPEKPGTNLVEMVASLKHGEIVYFDSKSIINVKTGCVKYAVRKKDFDPEFARKIKGSFELGIASSHIDKLEQAAQILGKSLDCIDIT